MRRRIAGYNYLPIVAGATVLTLSGLSYLGLHATMHADQPAKHPLPDCRSLAPADSHSQGQTEATPHAENPVIKALALMCLRDGSGIALNGHLR
jgi:hypothetical protein